LFIIKQAMSEPYGGWDPDLEGPLYKEPSAAELEEKYGKNNLSNDDYALPMHRYMICVSNYLSQIQVPQMLEKQLDRRDLDTVCGIELYQLKSAVLDRNVLDFKNFIPDKKM
jgi:hypothetical protein